MHCAISHLGVSGTRRPLPLVASAIVVLFAAVPPSAIAQDAVTPPAVPDNLQVPAGASAFLLGHAVGTQNYSCVLGQKGFGWVLYAPQATLFDDAAMQTMTHFLSPNPAQGGTPRPTWQHSDDSSAIWAVPVPMASSTDPDFVAPGAIPWLLLQVVGRQSGPTGGDALLPTMYIHRVNTSGGLAPATGCRSAQDEGNKLLVRYTADYVFYSCPTCLVP